MPWLVGTALIHSLAVTEKRGAFRSWTVLLAIAAFSLSLLGTFLVRSGVLTSVHAFATDPRRGLYILGLLVLVIGASLVLFAWRAPKLSGGGKFALVSRESALLVNNVLLAVVAASVLLGTLYPLFLDSLGMGKISVGPPYFEAVFVPLMVPVVLLMAVGALPALEGRMCSAALLRRVAPWLLASIALGVLTAWAADALRWRMVVGMTLAAWVLIAVHDAAGRPPARATWYGIRRPPARHSARLVGHVVRASGHRRVHHRRDAGQWHANQYRREDAGW